MTFIEQVNNIEKKLEKFEPYSSLLAFIQKEPNIEGYYPEHMSEYVIQKIANV